jgi:hypothetical protein
VPAGYSLEYLVRITGRLAYQPSWPAAGSFHTPDLARLTCSWGGDQEAGGGGGGLRWQPLSHTTAWFTWVRVHPSSQLNSESVGNWYSQVSGKRLLKVNWLEFFFFLWGGVIILRTNTSSFWVYS